MRRALLYWAVVLVGCQPANAPPPSGTPCEAACANLARLGCVEATSECVATCDDQLAAGLGAVDPLCASRAADRAAMQQCGPELCL